MNTFFGFCTLEALETLKKPGMSVVIDGSPGWHNRQGQAVRVAVSVLPATAFDRAVEQMTAEEKAAIWNPHYAHPDERALPLVAHNLAETARNVASAAEKLLKAAEAHANG